MYIQSCTKYNTNFNKRKLAINTSFRTSSGDTCGQSGNFVQSNHVEREEEKEEGRSRVEFNFLSDYWH